MDSAFKSAPFSAYTDAQLEDSIARFSTQSAAMRNELNRRDAVRDGDTYQMTAGERRRFNATGKAR